MSYSDTVGDMAVAKIDRITNPVVWFVEVKPYESGYLSKIKFGQKTKDPSPDFRETSFAISEENLRLMLSKVNKYSIAHALQAAALQVDMYTNHINRRLRDHYSDLNGVRGDTLEDCVNFFLRDPETVTMLRKVAARKALIHRTKKFKSALELAEWAHQSPLD